MKRTKRKPSADLGKLRCQCGLWNRETQRDQAAGRKAGDRFVAYLRSLKSEPREPWPTSRAATFMAAMLGRLHEAETDEDCWDLLLEWTFARFWYPIVAAHVPPFITAHAYLLSHGHTAKNPLVWGDIDYGAWVEPAGDRKVIVVECYCAAADDNQHVFILEETGLYWEFHARRTYPRMLRVMPGAGWDYLKRASLPLYRRQKFQLNYGDCRDKGYAFSAGSLISRDKVDNAYYQPGYIRWALRELRSLFGAIEDAGDAAGRETP